MQLGVGIGLVREYGRVRLTSLGRGPLNIGAVEHDTRRRWIINDGWNREGCAMGFEHGLKRLDSVCLGLMISRARGGGDRV